MSRRNLLKKMGSGNVRKNSIANDNWDFIREEAMKPEDASDCRTIEEARREITAMRRACKVRERGIVRTTTAVVIAPRSLIIYCP